MTREPEILINNIVNFNQFYIFQMESHMMKASQREREREASTGSASVLLKAQSLYCWKLIMVVEASW